MNGEPRLVMHLVYRFDVGGMENGVVNLINRMPSDRFRHIVVALSRCAPAFCRRENGKSSVTINPGIRVKP